MLTDFGRGAVLGLAMGLLPSDALSARLIVGFAETDVVGLGAGAGGRGFLALRGGW